MTATPEPVTPAQEAELQRLARTHEVQGHCPACGGTSLFLGDGGYVTCSRLDCPDPDAASTLLERDPREPDADTEPAEPELIPVLDYAIRRLATAIRNTLKEHP